MGPSKASQTVQTGHTRSQAEGLSLNALFPEQQRGFPSSISPRCFPSPASPHGLSPGCSCTVPGLHRASAAPSTGSPTPERQESPALPSGPADTSISVHFFAVPKAPCR